MNLIYKNKWKSLIASISLVILLIYGISSLPSQGLRALKNEAKLLEDIASANIIYRRDRDSHMPLIGGMSKPYSAQVNIKLEPIAEYSSDELGNTIKNILLASSWKVDENIKTFTSLTKNYSQNNTRKYFVNIFISEDVVSVMFTD